MKAIVLTSTLYSDDSYMVNLLTDELGIVVVSVRVGKRSTVRTSHIQPLTPLLVTLDGRPSQRVMRIKECQALPFAAQIAYDPIKSIQAQFIAEVLSRAVSPSQSDIQLFHFVEDAVFALNNLMRGEENFHLIFLLKLTHYLGFFPNIEGFASAEYFNMENGCFEPAAPYHTNYVHPTDTIAFAQLLRMDYDTAYLYDVNRTQRNQVLDYILKYYNLHIPTFSSLRSLEILRSLSD